MNTELNEAAEKYAEMSYDSFIKTAKQFGINTHPPFLKEGFKTQFIQTVKSDAAKQYWYAQWQAEQKQMPTDEEIEKLAEKEYPYANESVFNSWKRFNHYQSINRKAFINGFKSALQYSVPNNDVWEWVAIFYGALNELVELKQIKDVEGKTADYIERQPKAWYLANKALFLWKKSDYGAKALQYSVGDGWIDVKYGLPEPNKPVNVYYESADFVNINWIKNDKQWAKKINNGKDLVTHWQPLPSPPINK